MNSDHLKRIQKLAGENNEIVFCFEDDEPRRGHPGFWIVLMLCAALALCGCKTSQPVTPQVATNATSITASPPIPPIPTTQSVASLIAPHALVFIEPPPPDTNYSITVEVAWDAETNVDGYILYAGNQSGSYSKRTDESTNSDVTFTWDSRQPLFCSVTAYLAIPCTNCFTNSFTNRCVTNSVTESAHSSEVFVMYSNAAPFVAVTGGTATYTAYGFTNVNYAINATKDFTNWDTVLNVEGTNGPFAYTESLTNNSDYFQLSWTTNQ
jgi:hypothetical protein